MLTNRYSKSESPLLKEQRELINLLVEEKKANEDKYTNLQKAIESAQVNNHFQALTPSISQDTASTTSTAYDPSTEVKEYYTLVKNLLERVDACKYTLDPSRHRRIRYGVMNVHLAEEKLFRSVDEEKLSQLIRGDPIFVSQAMHAPAEAIKMRKAQPAFANTRTTFTNFDTGPLVPPLFDSSPIHPATETNGQTSPPAFVMVTKPKMFGSANPSYDHRGSETGYEPLFGRGFESQDSPSHSADDVSNAVEVFVLEWTTIDKGELHG